MKRLALAVRDRTDRDGIIGGEEPMLCNSDHKFSAAGQTGANVTRRRAQIPGEPLSSRAVRRRVTEANCPRFAYDG